MRCTRYTRYTRYNRHTSYPRQLGLMGEADEAQQEQASKYEARLADLTCTVDKSSEVFSRCALLMMGGGGFGINKALSNET